MVEKSRKKEKQMNKVIINGKITNVKTLDKVIYINVLVHNKQGGEFVPVTIFDTDFFNKYFYKGKWINIEGHVKMNNHKEGEYAKLEIIADQIHFTGNLTEFDQFVNEQYANTQQ